MKRSELRSMIREELRLSGVEKYFAPPVAEDVLAYKVTPSGAIYWIEEDVDPDSNRSNGYTIYYRADSSKKSSPSKIVKPMVRSLRDAKVLMLKASMANKTQ